MIAENPAPSMDEIWKALIVGVLEQGQRVQCRNNGSYEIIGEQFVLSDITRVIMGNHIRKFDIRYALAELIWYLSGSNDGEMIKHYAPRYAEFLEEDGTAHGGYGPRIVDQVPKIIEHLREHPNSRRAIVNLWNPETDLNQHGKKDLPCTLTWSFYVRLGRIFMVTNMRSNDLWLGTPYDVFCFTSIQQMIANSLKINFGTYTHQVGSLHLYEKNWNSAGQAIWDRDAEVDSKRWIFPCTWEEGTRDLPIVETHARHGEKLPDNLSKYQELYNVLVGGS